MALPRWLYFQVDIHSCVLLCSHFCRPLCGQLCSKPWAKFKTAQKPHPNVALPRNPRALFFKAVGPRIKIRLSDGPRNLGDFVTVASAAGWQFDNFDDFCLFLMKSRGRHSNVKKYVCKNKILAPKELLSVSGLAQVGTGFLIVTVLTLTKVFQHTSRRRRFVIQVSANMMHEWLVSTRYLQSRPLA